MATLIHTLQFLPGVVFAQLAGQGEQSDFGIWFQGYKRCRVEDAVFNGDERVTVRLLALLAALGGFGAVDGHYAAPRILRRVSRSSLMNCCAS